MPQRQLQLDSRVNAARVGKYHKSGAFWGDVRESFDLVDNIGVLTLMGPFNPLEKRPPVRKGLLGC